MLRFDRLVHAFGFGAASVACWQALVPRLTARPDARVAVLAALAGMGIGAINEVVEFAASRLSSTNVGGYSNTDSISRSTRSDARPPRCGCFGGHAEPNARRADVGKGRRPSEPLDRSAATGS